MSFWQPAGENLLLFQSLNNGNATHWKNGLLLKFCMALKHLSPSALITSSSFFFFTPVSLTTLKASYIEKNILPPKNLPFFFVEPPFHCSWEHRGWNWEVAAQFISIALTRAKDLGRDIHGRHSMLPEQSYQKKSDRKISQKQRNWNHLEEHRTAQKRYSFNRALIKCIWKSKQWDLICPLGIALHMEGRGCSVVTHSQG